ncbi:regulator of DNA class I crossover intermediates 1 [Dendropsophus ebraccatus]|uniref:regulator of DNA class I crossover intermediates 1 n=1 Tax=Dendropsophus ebraccatus TaxID=150705 RepID=UPI0038317E31
MNWVGGSRSRMVFNQERQKQREFFQKKKMKSKLKLLELSYSTQASPSLDLLNLQVINQISKKKERSKHPQHVDMCRTKDTISDLRKNVQLPMSPITIPSKICLDDSEITSLQAEILGSRTDQNLQNYITKQELIYEEKIDMTTEAKSRSDFHNETNVKEIRQELEFGCQHCLYGKCKNDNNGVIFPSQILKLDNKVKCLSTLSLCEMQNKFSPRVSKVNLSGKQDVAVQCCFEQGQVYRMLF